MTTEQSTLRPVLRELTRLLLDLESDQKGDSNQADPAELILSVLGSERIILIVDPAGRDIRRFAELIARMESMKVLHRFCSTAITFSDLKAAGADKRFWLLEQVDSLARSEQDRIADYFLNSEEGDDQTRPILIATVSSLTATQSLSQELNSALGAIVPLGRVSEKRLRQEVTESSILQQEDDQCIQEWEFLKKERSTQTEDSLVENIVNLSDRIATSDTSSVTERPPIDALKTQARVLSLIQGLRSAYGETSLDFGELKDFHADLLAHRLNRIDSQGKSNRMIVAEAVESLFHGKDNRTHADKRTALLEAKGIFKNLNDYLSAWVIGRDDDGHVIEVDSKGTPTLKGAGTINLMLAALFSEGHILFEDYPGTGKSYMIEKLSDCIVDDIVESGIDLTSYKHIQCVPDLLPSDLTGGEIFAGDTMVFRPGPVFAYLVLIDEINRTTPKVQAALLEAMSDRKVTIGNHEYNLGTVFFVLATQNPLDTVGTYPLPQAQLDRFIFKRRLEPLDNDSVRKVMDLKKDDPDLPKPENYSVKVTQLAKAIAAVKKIDVDPTIKDLLIRISDLIKELTSVEGFKNQDNKLGVLFQLKEGSTPSPRSLQKFMAGLKSIAFIDWAKSDGTGSPVVTSDHVRKLAKDYFSHRITPMDDEKQDPKILGALVDAVVTEAIQAKRAGVSSHL
jgi:MoxR-like ATPase/cell division protein FtsL